MHVPSAPSAMQALGKLKEISFFLIFVGQLQPNVSRQISESKNLLTFSTTLKITVNC